MAKYTFIHCFKSDNETQRMLFYLRQITGDNKSKIIRESIKYYYDSLCQ